MTASLSDPSADSERLERNKRVAWGHFRALAEGRLADALAAIDETGTYWRNLNFEGACPTVSLQVWKDGVRAMIERRLPIPWQAGHVHLVNIFAEGDEVVLEIHNDSTPYHEGARDESYDMVYLFTVRVRDGRIVGIREYLDGFLMHSMLADGSAPELGTGWLDLKAMEKRTPPPLLPSACAYCGMVHQANLADIAEGSPDRLEPNSPAANTRVVREHFRALIEGRLDDAVAMLDMGGVFWGAARIGADPRRPFSIEFWRRELAGMIDHRFAMPWSDGVHLLNVVAEGDQVLFEIHNMSTLRPPIGGTYNAIYSWVFTVRDGKIADIRQYPDGLYAVEMHKLFYPGTGGTVSPLTMGGELPPVALDEGSCLSCGKVHRS
jgi:ketosteroid isomerase-like protein